LRRAGCADPPVAESIGSPPATRRRIDLAIRRIAGGVIVGLHRAHTTDVVDLTDCLVVHPELAALIAALRVVLPTITALRRAGEAIANRLDTGIDLLLRTDAEPSPADRARLADFAGANRLCRLSWSLGHAAPEPIAVLRPPEISLAGAVVSPPPSAFLQATPEGEAAIVRAVLAGLGALLARRTHIVELYAGCGTLTFPLAARAKVQAFERDAASVAALRAAVARSGLAGRVRADVRDLDRQPLQPSELKGATAVVLDPPFAGAAAQVGLVATSGVARVIYVSCNPTALARDARLLINAGYTVAAATPIDQFLWSARLESVVAFNRPSRLAR
jgi:23S rRNA (uracil1939-C5)-methyltransferase